MSKCPNQQSPSFMERPLVKYEHRSLSFTEETSWNGLATMDTVPRVIASLNKVKTVSGDTSPINCLNYVRSSSEGTLFTFKIPGKEPSNLNMWYLDILNIIGIERNCDNIVFQYSHWTKDAVKKSLLWEI